MKTLLTLLLVALSTIASAQNAKVDLRFGYAVENTNFDELNGFVNSYNAVMSPVNPFSQFTTMQGYTGALGFRWRTDGHSFGYGFEYRALNTEANTSRLSELHFAKQELLLNSREGYMWFEVGSSGDLSASGFLALNGGFARLKSASVYANGSRSYGSEAYFNGIYRSFSLDWDVGVTVRYDFGPCAVFARGTLLSRRFLISEENEKQLQEFDDTYTYRPTSGRRFPKDFQAYVDTNGAIGQYETVGGGLRGMRLQLGFALALVNVNE